MAGVAEIESKPRLSGESNTDRNFRTPQTGGKGEHNGKQKTTQEKEFPQWQDACRSRGLLAQETCEEKSAQEESSPQGAGDHALPHAHRHEDQALSAQAKVQPSAQTSGEDHQDESAQGNEGIQSLRGRATGEVRNGASSLNGHAIPADRVSGAAHRRAADASDGAL